MTLKASVMEHVTFGFALCKSRKITRKNYAKNAQIPALGYGAVQKKDESQEAKLVTDASFSRLSLIFIPKSLGIIVVVKNDYEATEL